MLTREGETVQVPFDKMEAWPEEHQKAIGQFVIACSQWEHLYELLCKDLKITPDSAITFADQLAAADYGIARDKWLKRVRETLAEKGNQHCKKILEQIDNLESKRELRHQIIHGFHHIYEGECKITRITKWDRNIGVTIPAKDIAASAVEINEFVRTANTHRRQYFFTTSISEYECTASAASVSTVSFMRGFELTSK